MTTIPSPYAWYIDRDHLFNPSWEGVINEAGTVGPHNAAGGNNQRGNKRDLESHYAHHHQFRMFDDDGELYYTGTLFWQDGDEPDEFYLVAPLADFGTPNAGAVLIKYTGKPGWDCYI